MKLTYSREQFYAAIDYVRAHNPYATNWTHKHVRDALYMSILALCERPSLVSTGTMGFMCCNNGDGFIDILVTPYFSGDDEEFLTVGE